MLCTFIASNHVISLVAACIYIGTTSLVHFFIRTAIIFIFPLLLRSRSIPLEIYTLSNSNPQSKPRIPHPHAADPPTPQPGLNTLAYPHPRFQTTTQPCPQAGSAPVPVPHHRTSSTTTTIRPRSGGWRLRRRRRGILRMIEGLVWGRSLVCVDFLLLLVRAG